MSNFRHIEPVGHQQVAGKGSRQSIYSTSGGEKSYATKEVCIGVFSPGRLH